MSNDITKIVEAGIISSGIEQTLGVVPVQNNMSDGTIVLNFQDKDIPQIKKVIMSAALNSPLVKGGRSSGVRVNLKPVIIELLTPYVLIGLIATVGLGYAIGRYKK